MSSTLDSPELLDDFDEFLGRYYADAIAELAQAYPRDATTLTISYGDVLRYDPDLADDLVENPDQLREYLEEALAQYELPIDIALDGATIQFEDLPPTRQFDVGDCRSRSIGELIAVTGQVAKRTGVKSLPVEAAFECRRCGTMTRVPQRDAELKEPHECQGCERQGPFGLNKAQSEWVDVQRVRMQLPPEQAQGASSASLDVELRGDLVNSADAGDRVTVSGVHDVAEDDDIGHRDRLDADSVTLEESDYQNIDIDEYREDIEALANGEYGDPYDLLVNSIAPEIVAADDSIDAIKRALGLQLFGGVRCETTAGSQMRGDIHILLLGDPGTAKSTMLEAVKRLSPRSAMASGKGASEAGMTAAAVKDNFGGDQWTLEAGVMVLADGGIACVDEIDKVDEGVVQSLHQAMSRQVVPIDKAGINCELPSRTALLAAGNPEHGRFDPYEPVADQIDLGPTILSRFDLHFMLHDEVDEETDSVVAAGKVRNRDQAIANKTGDLNSGDSDIDMAVDADLLRAWIAHAKQSVQPRWNSEEVRDHVEQSFIKLRTINGEGEDDPIPATYRALDGMQRLAEASARVRLSETVEIEDVERATTLYWESMRDVGKDPESNQIDADVVETGQSKSQRDRVRNITDLIEAIAVEYDAGAPKDVVLDRAEEIDISESKAEHEIMKLKQQGELYEPQPDHLRTT